MTPPPLPRLDHEDPTVIIFADGTVNEFHAQTQARDDFDALTALALRHKHEANAETARIAACPQCAALDAWEPAPLDDDTQPVSLEGRACDAIHIKK